MINKNPNYHLLVKIESQRGEPGKKGIILRNIPCEIFLPERSHETVWAHLELNDAQADVIGTFGNLFWQMSIDGWLRWGGTFTQVKAKECYIPNDHWPARRYGCTFQRINLPIEILDLEIIDVHHIGEEGVIDKGFGKGYVVKKPHPLPKVQKPEEPANVTFWLTDNRDFKTFRIETSHLDGSTEVKAGQPLSFKLLPNVEVTFDRHFTWDSDVKKGEHNRRESLAATLSLQSVGPKPVTVGDDTVRSMDDFLLLGSFATRWNTIHLGWRVTQWPYTTQRYRHGRVLPRQLQNPRHPVKQDYESGLIKPNLLPEFLQHAWPLWNEIDSAFQQMLREVLGAIIHAQSLDLHASFIAHYSALEMIVLYFRRTNSLEFVLSNEDEWTQFADELKSFIGQHPFFVGSTRDQKAKRQKAYDKIKEFNRVAFGTAFNAFCSHTTQAIPHDDLWPVDGKNSLSWIRNRLVHGELEGRDQSKALLVANSHLQWMVERCVLCLLSWPIEKSRVTSGYLNNFLPYKKEDWTSARETLFPRN